ncbi:hypothetical protein RHD99_13960 [Buttiauxella selenatireducens]|uniref:Uncharacterized protein n=1 Tax=Buttiauxella selenatireducens TaxID=3073902 RepID=A0ABY9S6K4_9ENTR|nr:hypothetical protein [Buttiauxella sp. R73]WMY72585.1 hypothetical protein RHD99_13960 [Buttiauxella sp. R73]
MDIAMNTPKIYFDQFPSLLGDNIFSEVTHYTVMQKSVVQQEAEQQVIECLKFLYLTSSFPEQLSGLFLPVEQAIDDVWHYLILQTREYRTLCEKKLPGQFFIEHRSMPYENYGQKADREKMIEEALRWIPIYRNTFGGFDAQSAPHWTMVRYLHEQLGMTLLEINGLDTRTT